MIQQLHDFIPVNSPIELPIYQKILENTAIIVIADAQRNIIYVNQRFCDKSGFQREEVMGKPMDIIRSSAFSKEELIKLWQTLESGKEWQGELLNQKSPSESYWEEAVIYPFIDHGGKPYQFISIGSDITPFKNAMQIKDQFLSNMSHELRTPLHGIYSLTNLLEETKLTDEQSTYVENILNATDILMRMVEDMLDLNKIEKGEIKFQDKIFNPQIIVNSLAKMMQERIREKKLTLSIDYHQGIPEFVLGDPFRLKQVLIHLMENAVKYTCKGNIAFNCRLALQEQDKYVLEFCIRDTGIGIAPENLHKILEKFQQEKMDDKRIYKGQGLGLAIVKQLIELQQGVFSISSLENEGTEVKFTIPYQSPKAELEANEDGMTGQQNISAMKVLIAEDVDINQLVIKKHMQKFGFHADFAENGKIALEKLRKGNYDIILMDMQMPVMDGYEAIRAIRKDFPHPVCNIPIISITASVMGEAPKKCLEAGANDYVPKPYDIKELRLKMEKWVALKNNIHSQIPPIMHSTNGSSANGAANNEKSLIDLEYLNQLSDGDDDFSIQMMSYFLDNTPAVLREMSQFYDEKDWKALRNVAHKFKPQLTFMGIKAIFNEVEAIEQYAASVQNTDEIPGLIIRVKKVCDQATLEIKTELEKLLDKNQE